jgi:hypothetical protein
MPGRGIEDIDVPTFTNIEVYPHRWVPERGGQQKIIASRFFLAHDSLRQTALRPSAQAHLAAGESPVRGDCTLDGLRISDATVDDA